MLHYKYEIQWGFAGTGKIVRRERVSSTLGMGSGFESHWHHFVVSLSKTHLFLLSTGSTQEDPSGNN